MELKVYNKLCFYNELEDFEKECFHRLKSFHWESDPPYRPDTYFKMGVVDGDLVAILKCYEENPRAVFETRDAPVYRDSCLEFFVAPFEDKDGYINVEVNSKGVFLCEFGTGKFDRVPVSSLTELSPIVEAFKGEELKGAYWGVKVTLTKAFLVSVYKTDDVAFETVRANFYKCGDDCEVPHYIAYSPVTTLPPGFHNPECFTTFKK